MLKQLVQIKKLREQRLRRQIRRETDETERLVREIENQNSKKNAVTVTRLALSNYSGLMKIKEVYALNAELIKTEMDEKKFDNIIENLRKRHAETEKSLHLLSRELIKNIKAQEKFNYFSYHYEN